MIFGIAERERILADFISVIIRRRKNYAALRAQHKPENKAVLPVFLGKVPDRIFCRFIYKRASRDKRMSKKQACYNKRGYAENHAFYNIYFNAPQKYRQDQ
jgi:hypothetical protein